MKIDFDERHFIQGCEDIIPAFLRAAREYNEEAIARQSSMLTMLLYDLIVPSFSDAGGETGILIQRMQELNRKIKEI